MSYEIVESAPREVRLRSVVQALGMIVVAFVAGIAFAAVGINVLAFAGYGPETDPVLFNVVSSALQYLGFFVAVVVYVDRAGERDLIPIRSPGVVDVGWMITGFIGLIVATYVVGIVVTQLDFEIAENVAVVAGRENPDLFLWLVPIALVFVGPAEELVFRGVVQGLFKRAYGVVPAILITSALFGVVHFVALVGSGTVVYLGVAAALGLVLGTVYEKSQNIVVPAVVHGLWNAMLFLGNWYIVVNDVQLPA